MSENNDSTRRPAAPPVSAPATTRAQLPHESGGGTTGATASRFSEHTRSSEATQSEEEWVKLNQSDNRTRQASEKPKKRPKFFPHTIVCAEQYRNVPRWLSFCCVFCGFPFLNMVFVFLGSVYCVYTNVYCL